MSHRPRQRHDLYNQRYQAHLRNTLNRHFLVESTIGHRPLHGEPSPLHLFIILDQSFQK